MSQFVQGLLWGAVVGAFVAFFFRPAFDKWVSKVNRKAD